MKGFLVFVIFCALTVGSVWLWNSATEYEYETQMSPKVKAQHLEMAAKLRSVKPGDFLYYGKDKNGNERIDCVASVRIPLEGNIAVRYSISSGGPAILPIVGASRVVVRIVKFGDPDWQEYAAKFLEVPTAEAAK